MRIMASDPDELRIVVTDLQDIEREHLQDLGYSFKESEQYDDMTLETWEKERVPEEKLVKYLSILGLIDNINHSFGGHIVTDRNGFVVAEYHNEKEKWNVYKYLIGMNLYRRKEVFSTD